MGFRTKGHRRCFKIQIPNFWPPSEMSRLSAVLELSLHDFFKLYNQILFRTKSSRCYKATSVFSGYFSGTYLNRTIYETEKDNNRDIVQ